MTDERPNPDELKNPELEEFERMSNRRFASAQEALAASEEILKRFGHDSEVVRRHRSTPVDVSFEM